MLFSSSLFEEFQKQTANLLPCIFFSAILLSSMIQSEIYMVKTLHVMEEG